MSDALHPCYPVFLIPTTKSVGPRTKPQTTSSIPEVSTENLRSIRPHNAT
jgi:hypothetical protein